MIYFIYLAYIGHKINYASVVWNPQYTNHRLEAVKTRFFKYISYKST